MQTLAKPKFRLYPDDEKAEKRRMGLWTDYLLSNDEFIFVKRKLDIESSVFISFAFDDLKAHYSLGKCTLSNKETGEDLTCKVSRASLKTDKNRENYIEITVGPV